MKNLVYLLPALFFFSVACDRNELEEITPYQLASEEAEYDELTDPNPDNYKDISEYENKEEADAEEIKVESDLEVYGEIEAEETAEVTLKKEVQTSAKNKPYHYFNSVKNQEIGSTTKETAPVKIDNYFIKSTNDPLTTIKKD